MDLEDRRVYHEKPKIKCHERNHNRKESIYHWKTKGKIKCRDKGTTKIQKPAQINPLMTVLMSCRPELGQPPATSKIHDGICAERLPLTAYGTVILRLPEGSQYKPTVKKSAGARKTAMRKCMVPDPNELKLGLRR